ncbi:hypothetical protein GCM10027294_08430 [Marinactinospora endophytica]
MTLTVDPGLGAPGYLEPFLGHLAEGDEPAAVGLLTGAATRGIAAERLLLDVVAPAQRRVGELWASGQWDVAREHAATAISERAVAAVTEQAPPRPHRGRITVACVEGEWHALSSRLVAGLEGLRDRLADFPRSSALLMAGADAVGAGADDSATPAGEGA